MHINENPLEKEAPSAQQWVDNDYRLFNIDAHSLNQIEHHSSLIINITKE